MNLVRRNALRLLRPTNYEGIATCELSSCGVMPIGYCALQNLWIFLQGLGD
jgi:hypothetical protein